jgi:hypothetical protein
MDARPKGYPTVSEYIGRRFVYAVRIAELFPSVVSCQKLLVSTSSASGGSGRLRRGGGEGFLVAWYTLVLPGFDAFLGASIAFAVLAVLAPRFQL